jgi:hypothetical protein
VSAWDRYLLWVDRDVHESWPAQSWALVIPIIPLLPNFLFAWISVSEAVRLSILAVTCIPMAVLYWIGGRAVFREVKLRWKEARALKKEGVRRG